MRESVCLVLGAGSLSELYDRFRATATRLINRFDQEGTSVVVRVVTPNPDPTLPPDVDEDIQSIPAVARGVTGSIVTEDPNIQATDIQMIVDTQTGWVPSTSEWVELNGANRAIVRVDEIPAAGDPVAYRFFIR